MLLDSWAWVEYFLGSPAGAAVREIIRGKELYCSVLSIAEVADWCVRRGFDPQKYVGVVTELATVLVFDSEMAQEAGESLAGLRKKSSGIGMVDAIIYVQALNASLPLVTGDAHFRNLPGVRFLE